MAQIPIYLFDKLFSKSLNPFKVDLQIPRQVFIYPNVMLSFITCQETFASSWPEPQYVACCKAEASPLGPLKPWPKFLLRSLHEACEGTLSELSWYCQSHCWYPIQVHLLIFALIFQGLIGFTLKRGFQ